MCELPLKVCNLLRYNRCGIHHAHASETRYLYGGGMEGEIGNSGHWNPDTPECEDVRYDIVCGEVRVK